MCVFTVFSEISKRRAISSTVRAPARRTNTSRSRSVSPKRASASSPVEANRTCSPSSHVPSRDGRPLDSDCAAQASMSRHIAFFGMALGKKTTPDKRRQLAARMDIELAIDLLDMVFDRTRRKVAILGDTRNGAALRQLHENGALPFIESVVFGHGGHAAVRVLRRANAWCGLCGIMRSPRGAFASESHDIPRMPRYKHPNATTTKPAASRGMTIEAMPPQKRPKSSSVSTAVSLAAYRAADGRPAARQTSAIVQYKTMPHTI